MSITGLRFQGVNQPMPPGSVSLTALRFAGDFDDTGKAILDAFTPADRRALEIVAAAELLDAERLGGHAQAHGPDAVHSKIAGLLGKHYPGIDALNRLIGELAGKKRKGDEDAEAALKALRKNIGAYMATMKVKSLLHRIMMFNPVAKAKEGLD